MRKRAREFINEDNEHVQKKHNEDKTDESSKEVKEVAMSIGEARPTSISSSVTAPQPLTRQQLKGWTRKQVLESQAEAKKRRRVDRQDPRDAERKLIMGIDNVGISNGYGKEIRQLQARQDIHPKKALKGCDNDAIARR